MSRLRRRHLPGMQAPDLAPLVDVALILVVFLLLTAQMVDGQQLPVQLAQTTAGDAASDGDVTFTVQQDGSVWVGEQLIELEELEDHIQPGMRAVLRIDERCQHKAVVALSDALRAAGVERVVEATQEKKVETW